MNTWGLSIASGINGTYPRGGWDTVEKKALVKPTINIPEVKLTKDTNYFLLLCPEDVEHYWKLYPDLKEKNLPWKDKHSSMIATLGDENQSAFCSKCMVAFRPGYLKKFEEMKLNIQLESFGPRRIVHILNQRHQNIVKEEKGYERKMH